MQMRMMLIDLPKQKQGFKWIYPPVNTQNCGKSPFWIVKSLNQMRFARATLNYWRVNVLNYIWNPSIIISFHGRSSGKNGAINTGPSHGFFMGVQWLFLNAVLTWLLYGCLMFFFMVIYWVVMAVLWVLYEIHHNIWGATIRMDPSTFLESTWGTI